jgi:hypothetical protein
MTFSDDLTRFRTKVVQIVGPSGALFPAVCAEAMRSIVEGSELTGSPGQPVDTGVLRASWQLRFESPTVALLSTNLVYAPYNEDGVTEDGTPYRQLSPVGGRHSVKHTIAGMPNIIRHEAERLAS